MKKIILTILIMVLIICSGCYEFYFNDGTKKSITPSQMASGSIDEPIFEDSISLEDLVADNHNKTDKLNEVNQTLVRRDRAIDVLEKLVMQKQKAIKEILTENDKIRKDAKTIESLIVSDSTTKPSIKPHIQTIVNSSEKINDLYTGSTDIVQDDDLGPIDIYPIDAGPIVYPTDIEPERYVNKKLMWLGIVLGILGLIVFVKFFIFKN